MKVTLIGSVSSSWHTLRALIDGGVELSAVLGLAPRHAARVSDFRDLAPLAAQAGAPFYAFDKISEPGVAAHLDRYPCDLLAVIGLSQLAPPELIARARAGAIGFHPTPLPRGRGRAPVFWTIYLGEPAAVSLFYLTDEADAGDLIVQRPVPVKPDDYAQDLIDRTNEALYEAVRELAPQIRSGGLPRRPQDHARATWTGRRTPGDGRIDWSRPADEIHRLIRAASRPYPGAFTHDRGRKVVVWRAERHDRQDHVGLPGQVLRVDGRRGPLVQCGVGHLWLTETEREPGEGQGPAAFAVGSVLGLRVEAAIEALEARVRALESRLPPVEPNAGNGGSQT